MWREKKTNNKNQKTQTVMWWSHHFFSISYAISFLFLQNKTYKYTQWSQKFTLLHNVMLKIFSGKQIYICILQSEIKQRNWHQCRSTHVILGYDSKHKKEAPVIKRPSDWNVIDQRFLYTSSFRVSLYKRRWSETSQKAIKVHWKVITESCTNRKSVQQVLTSIPQFHSSRLFRQSVRYIQGKWNWNLCMYLVEPEALFTAEGTYVPGRYLLFSLEPCFDEIFFLKAFYNQSLSAHKSRVRVTGGMRKLSIRIGQHKVAEDSSSACRLPLNCYFPG